MAVTITAANLRAIAGGRAPLAEVFAKSFNATAEAFGLTTPLRAAHFLGQLAHESKFVYAEEVWGPTPAQRRYEGRADLGNVHPGDGYKYRGRGPIQCTGRDNYRAFTAWVRKRQPSAPDFEAQPDLVAEFPWALMAAFWFWDTRKINALADRDDVLAVSIKINGKNRKTGLPNGLEDRKAMTARAKAQLGVTASPAPRKPASDRMAISDGKWAEDTLASFEVEAIQKRLRDLGYYQVGKVDGKWGPSTKGALIALQATAGIEQDGHWGPQTKAALADDKNRRKVDPNRAKTTADDLRAQGSSIVRRADSVGWSGIVGLIIAIFGVAYEAWQSPAELPMGSSIFLGFLPPPFGAILTSIGPWLLAFVPPVWALLKSRGIVDARVVAEQTGLHNGEPDPAPSPPVTHAPDGPRSGGLFGGLFGAGR